MNRTMNSYSCRSGRAEFREVSRPTTGRIDAGAIPAGDVLATAIRPRYALCGLGGRTAGICGTLSRMGLPLATGLSASSKDAAGGRGKPVYTLERPGVFPVDVTGLVDSRAIVAA